MTWNTTAVLLAACWLAVPLMMLRRDLFRRPLGSPRQLLAWLLLLLSALVFVLLRLAMSLDSSFADPKLVLKLWQPGKVVDVELRQVLTAQVDALDRTTTALKYLTFVMIAVVVALGWAVKLLWIRLVRAEVGAGNAPEGCPA